MLAASPNADCSLGGKLPWSCSVLVKKRNGLVSGIFKVDREEVYLAVSLCVRSSAFWDLPLNRKVCVCVCVYVCVLILLLHACSLHVAEVIVCVQKALVSYSFYIWSSSGCVVWKLLWLQSWYVRSINHIVSIKFTSIMLLICEQLSSLYEIYWYYASGLYTGTNQLWACGHLSSSFVLQCEPCDWSGCVEYFPEFRQPASGAIWGGKQQPSDHI